jgi:1-acyl-sn-glycerol-3-phosphate acyltransferase
VFTYDCLGEEHVPATGGAVVAANHPSYLDPVLLSLQVRRPIRFMAANFLFRVPVLGAVLRAFGAFPVDTGRGKGREAYAKAKGLVESGQVVGIFPEGRRSHTPGMEASLREGAARLAWETGAPLVPATITGAFRAWPHHQPLPKPARVRVRFHAPIDPGPWRDRPEDEALAGLLAALRARVEQSLGPGAKADRRTEALFRGPAPRPRAYETLPALAAVVLGVTAGHARLVVLAVAYLLYLGADWRWLPQRRLRKWLRNGSPLVFGLCMLPDVASCLGAPGPAAPAALWAVVLGSAFPYLYSRTRTALAFVRGWTVALVLEAAALALWPSAVGPHVALPLFAAGFAVGRRTVFWRYASAILVAWAALVPVLLGSFAAPHALPAAMAWLAARLFPYDPHVRSGPAPYPPSGASDPDQAKEPS